MRNPRGLRGSRAKRHARASQSAPPSSAILRLELFAYGALFAGVALAFSTELQTHFTLPKVLVLRAAVPVLAALWAVRVAQNDIRPLPRLVAAALVALSAWWIVTSLVAVHPATALHGADGRYNGLWNQLLFLFVFSIVASSRFEPADIETIVMVFVAALVPVAVYALVQYAGWDPVDWSGADERAAATIGNPVILAATLALAIPFALVFMLAAQTGGGRFVWGAAGCLLLGAAIATLSRGPLVAGILAVFVVLGAAVRERRLRLHGLAIAGLLLATVVVLVFGYRQIIMVRPDTSGAAFSAANQTIRDRLNTHKAAFQIVRDHPVTGVGLENYSIVYPRYRSPESERVTPDVLPTMVHNGYLQAAATTGFPGLVAYLALVGAVLSGLITSYRNSADRRVRWLLAGFIASIAGYLIQDLFGWLEVSLSAFFWILLGLGVALSRRPGPTAVLGGATRDALFTMAGAGAACAVWLTAQTVSLIRADRALRQVAPLSVVDSWPRVEPALAEVLRRTTSASHVDEVAIRYAERFAATGLVDLYWKSAELFREAQRRNPFNPYPLIHRLALDTTGVQMHVLAEAPESERVIPALVALDRNNAAVYEAIARLRLAQGRVTEAVANVEIARKLRPTHHRILSLEEDVRRAAEKSGTAR